MDSENFKEESTTTAIDFVTDGFPSIIKLCVGQNKKRASIVIHGTWKWSEVAAKSFNFSSIISILSKSLQNYRQVGRHTKRQQKHVSGGDSQSMTNTTYTLRKNVSE